MDELLKEKIAAKRQAKRHALQILYSWELNPEEDEELLEETVTETVAEAQHPFAHALVDAVKEHCGELDGLIASHLKKKWSITQLNVVDKNILRLGLAELLYPAADYKEDRGVVIDEAVRLAKDFGGEDSYRLVNGLLNKVAEEKKL